jgi:AraC-like DNA-binding protein
MDSLTIQPSVAAQFRVDVARARDSLSSAPAAAAGAAAAVAAQAGVALPDIAVEAQLVRIEALRRLNRTAEAVCATLDALVVARDLPQTCGRVEQLHQWHLLLRITEGRAVLSLAAASEALRFSGRCTAAKSELYAAVARAYGMLGDIDRGRKVMQERVLPMAYAADDPETISGASARMAGLLHVYACSAAGVEHYSLRFGRINRAGHWRRRLAEARALLSACEHLQPRVSVPGRCFFLAMAGLVESLLLGLDAGRARFDEGLHLAGARIPRSRLILLISYGFALRGAGYHDEAIERLTTAEALATQTDDKLALCEIFYGLALCLRALDRQAMANAAMAAHSHLHTQLSLLAIEWSTDPRWLDLFGHEPNLDALRNQLLTAVQPPALDRADEYISGNLARRLSVPEIARQAGVSARTLQSLYRQYRGCPVSLAVRDRRMSLARQLLANGQLSVAKVAECIGYSAPANFSRDFKARYGHSPAETRDRSPASLDELLALGD